MPRGALCKNIAATPAACQNFLFVFQRHLLKLLNYLAYYKCWLVVQTLKLTLLLLLLLPLL
jgi:hypothetical protein